jgi:hypothetical protein
MKKRIRDLLELKALEKGDLNEEQMAKVHQKADQMNTSEIQIAFQGRIMKMLEAVSRDRQRGQGRKFMMGADHQQQ